MCEIEFAHIFLCETGGEGGCGDFEVVSKMKKVRKCLKQKNPLVKKRKTPLNVMKIVFSQGKTHKCIFLESLGQ